MEKANYILALDTAMSGCSACVYDVRSGQGWKKSEIVGRAQSERLVPMIGEVLAQAGMAYGDVNAIVTTVGPGAFAGLRIGLSTARAFGLALDIPVFGITTTQAMALQYVSEVKPKQSFTVALETKRTDFYMQIFDAQGHAICDPAALSFEDLHALIPGEMIVIGDAAARFKESAPQAVINTDYNIPDPEMMARALIAYPALCSESAEPLYLRDADVSLSTKPQRTIA